VKPGAVDEVAVREAATGRPVSLSRRERSAAIRLLADKGLTRAEIARRLHIKPETVTRNMRRNQLREATVTYPRGSSPKHIPAHHPTPQGRWTEDALCTSTDPELFAPPPEPPRAHPNRRQEWERWVGDAKAVCLGDPVLDVEPCPVRADCLAWALANDEWGIWGGTTDEDRQEMRRRGAA
jgi:WhiB family redox-sensing transcriptional regulator